MSSDLAPIALQRPAWDALTAGGMLLLVAVMSCAWLLVIARRNRRTSVLSALALGLILLANVAGDQLGLFSRLDLLPPPFVLLVTCSLALTCAVGMGYVGTLGDELVRTMPIEALVALQIFRLPLELLMLRAAYLGIMPMEFSMQGYNLDVLTGAGALCISIYCARTWRMPLHIIWIWNVVGIGCLVVIGILAALTSPNVHAFGMQAKHINSWFVWPCVAHAKVGGR